MGADSYRTPTDMHGPGDPEGQPANVSFLVAHCKVCGAQWQVKISTTEGICCSFCGAKRRAISLSSEAPIYTGHASVFQP